MNEITKCEPLYTKHANKYKTNVKNFDTVSEWEKYVKQVLITITDCQRRMENAHTRKDIIVAKLATEFFRPSPFELTDNLARTKNKWENLNLKAKKSSQEVNISFPENLIKTEDSLLKAKSVEDSGSMITKVNLECQCQRGISPPENSRVSSTMTQETSPKIKSTSTSTSRKTSKEDIIETTSVEAHKPAFIVTNKHKLICADSKFKMNFPPTFSVPMNSSIRTEEGFSCIPSVSVFSTPPKLSIIDDQLIDQTLKFTITNGSSEYVHLKYIDVIDKAYFSYAKVCPDYSHKLYPGMSIKFTLYFKLKMRKMVFTSMLFFKVTSNRIYDRPSEGFNVPIVSEYLKTRHVDVSKIVKLPSIYPWQFRKIKPASRPSGIIQVSVKDGYSYHLHIRRRPIDFFQPDEDSLASSDAPVWPFKLEVKDMAIIVDNLVQRAMGTFFIKTSYKYVKTSSEKYKIPVYLYRIEHIGCHNCYYDLNFYDAYTNEFIFRETTRIFADVLPSPLEISPPMLDMSSVPINYSFGESVFYITNNHKLFPVLIKIILSKKMKRIFRVIPMETVIPTTTTVQFQIKFCTLDRIRSACTDRVYFVFEIAMFGPKSIYKDMPHIYYEVVAPCLNYYKQITHRADKLNF